MELMEIHSDYSANYGTIPMAALNVACRRKLSIALNCDMPLPTSEGLVRNWLGLLELMGYPFETVRMLRNYDDPTSSLLDMWERDFQPTVAKLLGYLELIERLDVIDDILPLVERDCKTHMKRMETERRRLEHLNPIQVSEVSSVASQRTCPITVSEVIQMNSVRNATQETYDYDAYVSYVESDIQFVIKMIHILEKEYHLKLFVKERDMLPGVPESEADLRMIHERCERILLIISPAFLSDSQCEFYTMFAQAQAVDSSLYARKVIPVICEPCQLPVRLKYIARVDYTKKDYFESFWQRLYSSIKKPPQGELSTPTGSWTHTGYNATPPSATEVEPRVSPETAKNTNSALLPNPGTVFNGDASSGSTRRHTESEPLPDQTTLSTPQSVQSKKSPNVEKKRNFKQIISRKINPSRSSE